MKKKDKIIIWSLVGIWGVFSLLWMLSMPRYTVLQADRSLVLYLGQPAFSVSPAKIKVTNLWYFRPLTIEVKVRGGNYTVSEGKPQPYDKGYVEPNGKDFTISITHIDNNTEQVTIKRNKMITSKGQEGSFAITEASESNTGVSLVRRYIVEILLP